MKMKALLSILLIALITCNTVQEVNEEFDLEELEILLKGIDFKKAWNIVKKNVKLARNWLKKMGLYDPLMKILKQAGGAAAIGACTSNGIPPVVCAAIVEFLLSLIK